MRLQQIAHELIERGCRVVISNSTATLVQDLYRNAPGVRAYKVAAKRAINSDSRGRGVVMEYIISNVKPAQGPSA
jgi:DNA adenine methylase